MQGGILEAENVSCTSSVCALPFGLLVETTVIFAPDHLLFIVISVLLQLHLQLRSQISHSFAGPFCRQSLTNLLWPKLFFLV